MAVQKELLVIPDFGVSHEEGVFSKEKKVIANLKKAGLMIAGAAVQKYMMKLSDEQELLMNLADILIECYVAESTLLRWKETEPATDEPWWWEWANAIARWFRGLFDWLAASGRYLVWVLGALLAALLALYVARLVRTGGLPSVPQSFVAPSHVRDLDIRPESLPHDVGSAALALWERGEQRAALALLYRGLLSRLVHVHAVPIRASSTEGECLALARPRLGEPSARYAARLVETWAAAVYGGLTPDGGAVRALCREFGVALDGGAAAP
jgi:hypothetical protein